jgi:hypothetical protein
MYSYRLVCDSVPANIMADENPWKLAWKAVNHVLIGAVVFIVVGAVAVGIDLLVVLLTKSNIGVSAELIKTLGYSANVLVGVDLVLLLCFVVRTAWQLVKSL